MKIGETITSREQQIIRATLNMNDYKNAALETGFSFATINNLVNRLTKLNKKNIVCITTLFEIALLRIKIHSAYENEIYNILKNLK